MDKGYLRIAEDSEAKAHQLEVDHYKKYKRNVVSLSTSEAYARAVIDYTKAGDKEDARRVYLLALKFAPLQYKKGIINKIENGIKKITPIKKVEKNKSDLGQIAKELSDGFGNLVEFMIGRRDKLPAIIPVLSFVLALFFLSSNLTGFAVSSADGNDFNLFGICFFISGLIFTFIYLRNKVK